MISFVIRARKLNFFLRGQGFSKQTSENGFRTFSAAFSSRDDVSALKASKSTVAKRSRNGIRLATLLSPIQYIEVPASIVNVTSLISMTPPRGEENQRTENPTIGPS